MFTTELIVCGGVVLEYIILRVVSNGVCQNIRHLLIITFLHYIVQVYFEQCVVFTAFLSLLPYSVFCFNPLNDMYVSEIEVQHWRKPVKVH